MTGGMRHLSATQPVDLAELRLLAELAAVRRLANRGLTDEELGLVRRLADAGTRAARRGDAVGYVRADVMFHRCLLELTADRALSEIAPFLIADSVCAPATEQPGYLIARRAREHRELAGLLADGMVSAADHLLRLLLSRLTCANA
jgi:DNA-binding GntR family transcriptional regulator